MIVRWLAAAIDDLVALRTHVWAADPEAATSIAQRIISAASVLERFPAIGRVGRIAGTRELVIAGTSYVIAYRVSDKTVDVLRVFHGAQKWPERIE